MNRRERRIAGKPQRERSASGDLPGAGAWLALAKTRLRVGDLSEADALCGRILHAEPAHAEALYLRGLIARQQQRPLDALAHFNRALSIAPAVAAIHDGLAETYRSLGQPVDAERHYRRVAELQPGAVTLLNLGNALLELRRPADAAAAYEAALRLDARLAESYLGLGTALASLGRLEAADAFSRAIALRPDLAPAHEGLIQFCLDARAWDAALRAACDALLRADTAKLRVQFVDAVRNAALALDIPGLREAMQRAVRERWTRPQDLARVACELVALRQPFDVQDTLLRAVMEIAPIGHREAEQALTGQRRILLDRAASDVVLGADALAFACGLARQCFITEYAWRCDAAEHAQVERLRDAIESALACGGAPADTALATVAMYVPLGSLRGAGELRADPGSPGIASLLAQQVDEPAEEHRLRATIRRATAIEDQVSLLVRDQYEENPYPRWVAMAAEAHRIQLADWIAARFPAAPALSPPPGGSVMEVLVAGCGTGQQALETVRGFAGAEVLAIDLSLASLAYAARASAALGANTIEYVQADLLRSAQLGRSFDMIGVGGVLHHLADPWAGWRALLGVLRPGGVMNVLLYTVRGRGDVRAAREWIAGQGYRPVADDIRRCRQDLVARSDAWALRLAASPDFASVSGCRDLLFHVQEQAVTLPEVEAFLASEDIDLLGVEVQPAIERAFEEWCGDSSDAALRDLARWDRFEAEYPTCFAGMLNLWVRKRDAPLGLPGDGRPLDPCQ